MATRHDLPQQHVFTMASLGARKPLSFDIVAPPPMLRDIAAQLDLLALRKLRFQGTLRPDGRKDWLLTASLGATVLQPCVVTLEPVTTRIDETVERRFVAAIPEAKETGAREFEIPEDTTVEPLPSEIDLTEIMIEELALTLPDYPRSPDVTLEHVLQEHVLSDTDVRPEPGDDRPNPFAKLAALRQKLNKDS